MFIVDSFVAHLTRILIALVKVNHFSLFAFIFHRTHFSVTISRQTGSSVKYYKHRQTMTKQQLPKHFVRLGKLQCCLKPNTVDPQRAAVWRSYIPGPR